MKKTNEQKGITLIALVITIIILLILAGISISVLTDNGLFKNAKEAKEKSEEAQNLENGTLKDYENKVNEYLSGTGNENSGENGGQTTTPEEPTKPATSIAEAQKDYMLTKTVNSEIEDAKGNKIVIPAGFRIKVDEDTNNATTVDKGIVIIDSDENEFVWIPVGEITKADDSTVTINLDRYTFDSNGVATPQGDAIIDSYFRELATSTYGNTTAKNIEGFKTSVSKNGGYYIGRYEARKGTDALTIVTEKGTDHIYNYVTQPQATELAKNMYKEVTTFTSDLMNSYAWDTAIFFLQSCGKNNKYSMKTSVYSVIASTGTNNQTSKDLQCNVYDMASNVIEYTTESSKYDSHCCVVRDGYFKGSLSYKTCTRSGTGLRVSQEDTGFRPLLYL